MSKSNKSKLDPLSPSPLNLTFNPSVSVPVPQVSKEIPALKFQVQTEFGVATLPPGAQDPEPESPRLVLLITDTNDSSK